MLFHEKAWIPWMETSQGAWTSCSPPGCTGTSLATGPSPSGSWRLACGIQSNPSLECCSMRKPGSHGWKVPREPGPTWLHSPCSAAPRLGWAGKGKAWNNLRIDSVKTPAMSSPRSLSPAQLQDHQILRIRWQEFLPLRPKLCLSQEKNVWNVPSLFSTGMGFRCRDPTNHGSCQKSLLCILGWLPWDNPN